ncbi:MAG: glutathione S-transferase family protein [Hyphomicrobiaceae bacterium]
MKLHVTLTSPYARLARAALIEHGLEGQVEVLVAQTRLADSPYYRIAPSGRVPFLELDDGRALEESELICAYFDAVGNGPPLMRASDLDNWEYGRLNAMARSYVDGIAVWGREVRRPANEQSPTIIVHETARNRRLADVWEREIEHPLMNGALNVAQLLLYCAFDSLKNYTGVEATPAHPNLQAWRARLARRPSLAATPPPKRK